MMKHFRGVLTGRFGLAFRTGITGWVFVSFATIMIFWTSFYPMIAGFILSLQTGVGANMTFAGFSNYARLIEDPVFWTVIGNTFLYLLVQVPIMLVLALILASLLNRPNLKFKGLFRTCIFLPSATALVSYSIIFRGLFATDGYINYILMNMGFMDAPFNWLGTAWSARLVIILALLWRWTGFNMIFYLAALQNMDKNVYEAAKIDGAGAFSVFTRITIPMLKPIILLTAIMSTTGTMQLFDESMNLTGGGPARQSMTISHYIFTVAFQGSPNFGYAATLSYVIFVIVALLAVIQLKVGDRR